jgi:RNA polymerase sigma-70 factor (ECF subfamily)
MDTAPGELTAVDFEALFRDHQAEVYRWIVRIVRDRAAAEDLTIETFWRVYRALGRLDPSRPFLPWARRIATRAAIDHLRSARRLTPIEDRGSLAADPAEQREIRDHIARAFDSLAPPLKAAATLALVEELPYAEIADALDISLSAAKMRVMRAVRLLRQKLERKGIRP